ncbi:PRTRC system ThiF family protein [Pedobacter miscanthi]|uniref:PRTRC system ThiF family protein n=1 Tax=Pedobacter miscanthi TaxID=2259170 RepID=A0A366LEB6_9SPHI|nr:PRTRC system ThiF family protein [Pedobacter miscanthi]RBQ11492.1 PRTRC system ThiF family protein [Pedobacter miscanthi]
MKTEKNIDRENIHIVPHYFLHPTNPFSVNLIGVGGTGSVLLTALARINHALMQLGHAGLMVRAFDPDSVEQPNLGRQLFSHHEIGMNKAVALINRVNRFFGTSWEAFDCAYSGQLDHVKDQPTANITLSCVDTVAARLGIAGLLAETALKGQHRDNPMYWMDFGNSRDSGQVLLSTIGEIKQPESKKFRTIGTLPTIIEQYGSLLEASGEDELPSCSLAQALGRQDLFINSSLADLGASLLWTMFRTGMLCYRGFFLNLAGFKTTAIKV